MDFLCEASGSLSLLIDEDIAYTFLHFRMNSILRENIHLLDLMQQGMWMWPVNSELIAVLQDQTNPNPNPLDRVIQIFTLLFSK